MQLTYNIVSVRGVQPVNLIHLAWHSGRQHGVSRQPAPPSCHVVTVSFWWREQLWFTFLATFKCVIQCHRRQPPRWALGPGTHSAFKTVTPESFSPKLGCSSLLLYEAAPQWGSSRHFHVFWWGWDPFHAFVKLLFETFACFFFFFFELILQFLKFDLKNSVHILDTNFLSF